MTLHLQLWYKFYHACLKVYWSLGHWIMQQNSMKNRIVNVWYWSTKISSKNTHGITHSCVLPIFVLCIKSSSGKRSEYGSRWTLYHGRVKPFRLSVTIIIIDIPVIDLIVSMSSFRSVGLRLRLRALWMILECVSHYSTTTYSEIGIYFK